MKVFRFMSVKEFRKYMLGYKLKNSTNHYLENNMKTNSTGFCFFYLDDYKPEKALHMVSGIVNWEICAIFEVPKGKLKETWGRYSKFSQIGNYPMYVYKNYEELIKSQSFISKEYCTQEYEKNTFKLIAFAIPEWYNDKEWEWRDAKCQIINYQKK